MNFFESWFDIVYLILVISLGFRLVLAKERGAKTFGIMALCLGFGDAFHLIPRIFAHLTPNGFDQFASALSWGKMVTSLTMTVFYLLYYYYLKEEQKRSERWLDVTVWVLVLSRIALTLAPGNEWGSANPNPLWNIYRNIPFAILGVLLMVLSAQGNKLFKTFAVLIFLSFAFYVPVVLWADTVPVVGALMMPKTVAYLGLVFTAFCHYNKKTGAQGFLEVAWVSLIFTFIAGVFGREVTKIFKFTGTSQLSNLHGHILLVGCMIGLVAYFAQRRIQKNDQNSDSLKSLSTNLPLWVTGLVATYSLQLLRGVDQVLSPQKTALTPMFFAFATGLAHLILMVAILQMFYRFMKSEKANNATA